MNNLQSKLLLALLFGLSFSLYGQETITITDADLEPGQTYNWTANNTYVLDGFVFLEEEGILNIEAGTIIRALKDPSSGDFASALIITRGASINAEGDPCNPIIFTAEADDFDNFDVAGEWGGLVILGAAPINNGTSVSTSILEAIPDRDPRATYGGTAVGDNSGILRYVSIRYGGANLDNAFVFAGLTLAGVGNGTQVDHVETYRIGDDGIAMLGGNVNTKHMSSAFSEDDSFAWEEGYQGLGQFLFSIHPERPASAAADVAGTQLEEGPNTTKPTIYNATFLGAGLDIVDNGQEELAAVRFFNAGGGELNNSVIADFSGFGLFIEDVGDSNLDSYQRLLNGEIQLRSNSWIQIRSANQGDGVLTGIIQPDPNGDNGIGFLSAYLNNNNNLYANTAESFGGIARIPRIGQLDPRPQSLNALFQTDVVVPGDQPFFTPANYRGAFAQDLWIKEWTALDFFGYLPEVECDLAINLSSTNVTCFEANDGTITLEATEEFSALTIDWNVDAFDGQALLTNLVPGVYSVTVTNAECCEQQAEITIVGPDQALLVDCSNILDASGPGEADGAATIISSGGGAPETLVLTNPDETQENFSFADGNAVSIPGLLPGTYNAAVTDVFGCTVDCDFTIGTISPCFIIQDADLIAGGNYTWTADNCYIIDGLVFLESTGTLSIEPGTVIQARANPTTGQNTSALIIAKGANIDAQGTEARPIIFTAETAEDASPTDLTADDKGLWGGLAILGDAEIPNPDDDGGEKFWEVLDEMAGAGQYGGTATQNVTRNLSYVSIRHAGAAILPNQVFPALTLAAVRETAQLNHLEVFAAADRGIAFYGGLAQLSYASATFCEGPAFSWQDGYNGKGQFWFALSDPGSTNLMADHRGYINGATQDTVVSAPQIYNTTYIGGGGTGNTTAVAMRFRESSAGIYGNSIFTHFNGNALEVEDIAGDGNDSESLMDAEVDFFVQNNLFWGFGALDTIRVNDGFLAASPGASDPKAIFLEDHLLENRNKATDPKLRSISNIPNGALDPRPQDCAAFNENAAVPQDGFYDTVGFKGAFAAKDQLLWINDWTALADLGYLPQTLVSLDSSSCTITLAAGDIFIHESPDGTPLDSVRRFHTRLDTFADLTDRCHCRDEEYPRLTLWEAKMPTEVTNKRGGSEDSSIIDTSGLKIIFDPRDAIIDADQELQYCDVLTQGQTIGGVRVALIDSGVDFDHPQLLPYEWSNAGEESGQLGVDDDLNCFVDDLNGLDFLGDSTKIIDFDAHGTHLAGIIAGGFPSNLSLEIMNLKVYQGEAAPTKAGTVFDLVCAIHYAIDNGANVINLSLGYWATEPSIPLYNALNKAAKQGIPVIISMGNDSTNVDKSRKRAFQNENDSLETVFEYRWPVQYKVAAGRDDRLRELDNLISVGSLNGTEQDFAPYSNYGTQTLDVSTIGAFYSTAPKGDFKALQGTSMSTAAVTQLVAVARGVHPSRSLDDIRACLIQSTITGGSARFGAATSTKRLDFEAAYNCLGISREQRGIIPIGEPPGDDIRPIYPKDVDAVFVATIGDGKTFYENVVMEIFRRTGGNNQLMYRVQCAGGIIIWNCRLSDNSLLPNGSYFPVFTVNGVRLPNVVGNITKR